MEKKTTKYENPSFMQSITISNNWCKEWEDDLLSDEVLADRIAELTKTKNGLRGFFAYTLSDIDCKLLDKLPTPVVFKLREGGESIVEIIVKNLVMSTAQIFNHQKNMNLDYAEKSTNISERCKNLLRVMDTKLVTKMINEVIQNLDKIGNSMDNSTRYNDGQIELIMQKIKEISH